MEGKIDCCLTIFLRPEVSAVRPDPRAINRCRVLESHVLDQDEDSRTKIAKSLLKRSVRRSLSYPLKPVGFRELWEDFILDRQAEGNHGVQQAEASDSVRMAQGEPAPNRPAPVLQDEGYIARIQLQKEGFKVRDVCGEGVLAVLRCLALAEAHVVWDEHAMVSRKRWDKLAI